MEKSVRPEFSANLWMRRPTTPLAVHEPIELDELVMLFSKQLTIQGAAILRREGRRNRSSTNTSRRTTNPWYAATTTFAPRAPFFALVGSRVKPNRASTLASSRCAPTVHSPHLVANGPATCPSHACVHPRARASSSSSGSADESSCNEPITPPSSPPASVFLPKMLPDWTTILESVAT